MGFNSGFKGLITIPIHDEYEIIIFFFTKMQSNKNITKDLQPKIWANEKWVSISLVNSFVHDTQLQLTS